MSDEIRHECGVAMVVLRRPPSPVGDFGGTKLSLLMEKQHNRGQDGAGAAVLSADPEPGEKPWWVAKSASSTPLADLLGMIGKRTPGRSERIFLGHLRYATFGKNEVAFCHPFIHEASEL
ncbi:MAG: amidophosphoribosyltransferase, partial [Kiritimatiellae bacterium]|nr:amidophosphoribosyltransferase [Kiritimatiellia bacterium]